jgi:hypothetical protein
MVLKNRHYGKVFRVVAVSESGFLCATSVSSLPVIKALVSEITTETQKTQGLHREETGFRHDAGRNLFATCVHPKPGQIPSSSRLQKHSSLAKPRQRNAPEGEVS